MSIHMMYFLFDELEKGDDPFPSVFYIFGSNNQPEKPYEFEKMLKRSDRDTQSCLYQSSKTNQKNYW